MNIASRQQMCAAERHALGHAITVPADLADEPHVSFTSHVVDVHNLPMVDVRPVARPMDSARDNWRTSHPQTPMATHAEAAKITGHKASMPRQWKHRTPGELREAARQAPAKQSQPKTTWADRALWIALGVCVLALVCLPLMGRAS